ncbi:MAG TPA: hypothetical protein VF074_13970 [Pyrinomonadaceae bacterium]
MSTLVVTPPELLLPKQIADQNQRSLAPPKTGTDLQARLQREIDVALDAIESPAEYGIARPILENLSRLFEKLTLIQSNLRKLDTLVENLSILEMIQRDTRMLIDFIETKAMRTEGVSQELVDVLDGMSYCIAHDLKRIFERELVDYITDYSTPVVYGKIVYAHGLLSNCFQQTVITILQFFNPSVNPVRLFNLEERVRQSLVLCNELSSMMRVVRQAEDEGSSHAFRQVVYDAIKFRDESMQYLVYLDWREYERLAFELIASIETNGNSQELLHMFGCYLEVLYGHVKMRASLRDMFPSLNESHLVNF